MSYVGVGTDTQTLQLTSGRPKWQTVAAGGGGGFGVTVAQNIPADFVSIGAAISGSNTIMTIIGDTTEEVNIDVGSSGLNIIFANSSEVNLNDNSFLWSDNGRLDIGGNGIIRYATATAGTIFDVNGTIGLANVGGVEIKNESAGTATLASGTDSTFDNCIFNGEARLNGIRNKISTSDFLTSLTIESSAQNVHISSCSVSGSAPTDAGSGTILSDIRIY